MLRELRAHGFAVWPFDEFALPLVIEIYPRILTGGVIKRSPEARAHFVARFRQWEEGLSKTVVATVPDK